MTGPDSIHAPPEVRDHFLDALDAGNYRLSAQLALNLTRCINPFPGLACVQLGLPPGSTYGAAARHILMLYPVAE